MSNEEACIERIRMLRTFVAVVLLTLAPAGWAELPQVTNYVGSIGENLPVSMSLSSGRQSGVSGSYVYSQYGKPISLSGSRTYGNAPVRGVRITLKEADPGDGTFELLVTKDDTLSGDWKSSDGKRTFPVSLTPVAKTVTLVSARSDRYEIRTGYLQLTAGTPFAKALNADLERVALEAHDRDVRSLVTRTDQVAGTIAAGTLPYTLESTPFLLCASDTLVSIRSLAYTYTGGAHGNWGYTAKNYAWVRDALVEIPAERIIAESQWPALREMCVKELKAQGASWPESIKFDEKTPPNVNVTSRSLLVTFGPYEASSYADGCYVVSLLHARVKPLLAEGSPVAALVRR